MNGYVVSGCVGLILGVAVHPLCGGTGVYFFAILAAAVGVVRLVSLRRTHVTRTACATVFFIAAALGVVRMEIAVPEHVDYSRVGEKVTLEGQVVVEPDVRDGYTHIVLKTELLEHLVLVQVRASAVFHYGDTVLVKGVLERPHNFKGETGRVFNYVGYLAKDDVYYTLRTYEVDVQGKSTTFRGMLLSIKGAYLSSLKQLLPEPYAALAGGITVGEKRSLGDTLTQRFRDAGLIHVVVLSGYNIAIIVVALMYVLAFLPRRFAAVVSIGAILAFTLLVGASATVVRAALMGGIGALGIFFRRSYSALYALCIAGIAMVLWNPYVVLYDPSFQLSFMATLGLLLGAPLLLMHLMWVPRVLGIRELVAVTLATQIAVLPLLVYMMGSVSLVALPVNMVALPAIPLAMLLVFCTAVIGMVSTLVAVPFAWGAQALLAYVIYVVTLATKLPFATVVVPSVSLVWVIVMYTVLSGFVWARYMKENRRPV